jgi:hypothetical protein
VSETRCDITLTVNGETIAGSGKNLTIDGSGATIISAAVQTGTGSVIKAGSGTLVLNNVPPTELDVKLSVTGFWMPLPDNGAPLGCTAVKVTD